MAEPIKTLDLTGLNPDQFKVEGEDYKMKYVFGGRYGTDELVPMDDGHGNAVDMYKVTINLVLDEDQLIALHESIRDKNPIIVKLVSRQPQ